MHFLRYAGLAQGVITSGKNRGNYLGEKRGKRFLVFPRGKTQRRGKNPKKGGKNLISKDLSIYSVSFLLQCVLDLIGVLNYQQKHIYRHW